MIASLVKFLVKEDRDSAAINTPTNFLVKDPQCLMTRFFELFVVVTTTEYVVLNILYILFGQSMCNDTMYVREQFTKEVNIFICGSFLIYVVLHIFRIMSGVAYSKTRNMRPIYFAALLVTSVTTISSGMSLIPTSPVCVDIYG